MCRWSARSGPMCRFAKFTSSSWSRGRRYTAPPLSSTDTSCPDSRAACPVRSLLPERFRGGCPFGAGRWLRSDSPGRCHELATSLPRGLAGFPGPSRGELIGGLPGRFRPGFVRPGFVSGRLVWQIAGRKLGERAFDLLPDPAESDAEDALAALQQVDDFVA